MLLVPVSESKDLEPFHIHPAAGSWNCAKEPVVSGQLVKSGQNYVSLKGAWRSMAEVELATTASAPGGFEIAWCCWSRCFQWAQGRNWVEELWCEEIPASRLQRHDIDHLRSTKSLVVALIYINVSAYLESIVRSHPDVHSRTSDLRLNSDYILNAFNVICISVRSFLVKDQGKDCIPSSTKTFSKAELTSCCKVAAAVFETAATLLDCKVAHTSRTRASSSPLRSSE